MKYDEYNQFLNRIRPNSDHAASIWMEWAKELESYDSSHGELPEGTYMTAEDFLDTFAERIAAIQEKHGTEIAQQIISLADIGACPFPWEMQRAAEYLAEGGNISNIAQMERDGLLEDFSDGEMRMQI